jgi:hypothetical protein
MESFNISTPEDRKAPLENIETTAADLERKADEAVKNILTTEVSSGRQSEFKEAVTQLRKNFGAQIRSFSQAALFGSTLLAHAPPLPETETLSETINRAKTQLIKNGITTEQKRAYVLGFNDLIYKAIVPRAYTANSYVTTGIWNVKEVVDDNSLAVSLAVAERFIQGLKKERSLDEPRREDAWRMYLGMPQQANSFGVSDYTPTKSKDIKYYYKFNAPSFLLKQFPGLSEKEDIAKTIESVVGQLNNSKNNSYLGYDPHVMNFFTWSKGKDEMGTYLSYYDKWDLNVPLEKNGFFGQPFEVYDRIYYDSITYQLK